MIGLGIKEPAVQDTIATFKDLFAAANNSRYFVHIHPDSQPEDLKSWLREEGLTAHRCWITFIHGGNLPPASGSDLEVRQIGSEYGEDFGNIVATGFDFKAPTVPALAALTDRLKWNIFMGFVDGQPAATGALFVDKGVGWCDFGATSSNFRKRGGQRAMLHAGSKSPRSRL